MDVLKKTPVREQDPEVRATNFEEVCLGYNREEAMEVYQGMPGIHQYPRLYRKGKEW